MKIPSPVILLILNGLAAAVLNAAGPFAGEQHSKQTQARIEALFHFRDNPPSLPDARYNPFRTVDTPDKPVSETPPAIPDKSVLQRAVASLKISGHMQVGAGNRVILIRHAAYREGETIVVNLQGSQIHLSVLTITNDSVTFGLGDDALTVHF